ncbi:hypothetical protein BGZ54_005692 [Gamsiella multidivaricata]|nr:hypothetical protein BGZ54_005692 [Gamsiella multidivaricata]
MFARKGIVAATVASSRSAHFSILRHTDQSAALSFRITRLFSSSPARSASESARVPRPIPLDIGNGPTASSASAITEAASLSSSTAEAAVAGSARRSYRSSNNGSFFGRFGEPIINVLIYSTAASLVLHLIYHHLALEEYRIASNKKIADLEAEIETIKSRNASSSVQHSLGGRGEFV